MAKFPEPLRKSMSISTKLTVLTIVTSGSVVFLCCAAFVANDVRMGHEGKVLHMQALARVVGANCVDAVEANDAESARDTLRSLRVQPMVELACVYDAKKQLFAGYERKGLALAPPVEPPATPIHFLPESVEVTQVLLESGELKCIIYIRASMDDLRQQRQQYVRIVTIVMMVSLAATVTLSALLQRIITRPVIRLAETARRISQEGDYSLRVAKPSPDELGTLYEAFNGMLDHIQQTERQLQDAHCQLEARVLQRTRQLSEANVELSREVAERQRAESQLQEMQSELLDVARRAGMAEIATGVLHNVGNVLNSINVSVSLVLEWLRKSQVAQLSRAVELMNAKGDRLAEYLSDDPQGRKLPEFLGLMAQHLRAERDELLQEVETLGKNVEHVKTVIAMQQSYAGVSGVVEAVSPSELIDDALRMYSASLQKHGVDLVREEIELPPMLLEKQKALQILVNLVKNAKDSLAESGAERPRLTIRLGLANEHTLRVEVEDNGLGIAAENLGKIFRHGFTTKRDGHGFGLHSCAITAREMDGSLTVRSDGPGRGATFILELPFKPVEALV